MQNIRYLHIVFNENIQMIFIYIGLIHNNPKVYNGLKR